MKSNLPRTMIRLGGCLLAAAALSWSATAYGAPANQELAETKDLTLDDEDLIGFIVGAKASYILALEEGNTGTSLAGLGLFIETELIHHWVEVEFSARVVGGPDMRVPVDTIFKVPFHPGFNTHLFIGGGPSAVYHHGKFYYGGVASVGALYWFTETVGLIGEVNYNLISDHGAISEFGFNFGAAYHL